MEMSRTDKVIALGLAALAVIMLAAALSASAQAATYGNGFQVAKFKIEVEGFSNTTWKRNYEAENQCDVSDHSFGRERYTFKSTKPVYITATRFPGQLNPVLFATNAKLGIPTKARIERSFTPAIGAPPTQGCLVANGGGAEPTLPDCGTKVVKPWLLSMEFSEKKKGALQLHSDSSFSLPYQECPGATFTFPFLLDEQGTGLPRKPLYAELSADDLFDPKFQKWITIGDGAFKDVSPTWFAKTDVHWALSFTRLGGKTGIQTKH